jgi:hypothetical protein
MDATNWMVCKIVLLHSLLIVHAVITNANYTISGEMVEFHCYKCCTLFTLMAF